MSDGGEHGDRVRASRSRRGWCPRADRRRCRPRRRSRSAPRPTFSPMKSIGASSRSPSPMTIVPRIGSGVHRLAHRLDGDVVGVVAVALAHRCARRRWPPPRRRAGTRATGRFHQAVTRRSSTAFRIHARRSRTGSPPTLRAARPRCRREANLKMIRAAEQCADLPVRCPHTLTRCARLTARHPPSTAWLQDCSPFSYVSRTDVGDDVAETIDEDRPRSSPPLRASIVANPACTVARTRGRTPRGACPWLSRLRPGAKRSRPSNVRLTVGRANRRSVSSTTFLGRAPGTPRSTRRCRPPQTFDRPPRRRVPAAWSRRRDRPPPGKSCRQDSSRYVAASYARRNAMSWGGKS